MKQWQILAIAAVLALVSAAGGYQLQRYLKADDTKQVVAIQSPVAPIDVVDTKLEDFSLSDVNGEQRSISEWQGNIIVINFWATWCGPCREEIPAFVELQQQYSDAGLQFVGIALQEAEEVGDFINEFNVNYPILVGIDDVIQVAKKLGNDIGALPYTVIVDSNGVIAFTRRGPLSKSDAESVIQTLLSL